MPADPEDGKPAHPFLRLSVDTDDDNATVVLDRAQAEALGRRLLAWAADGPWIGDR